jgi:hypothetical protein
MVLLRRLLILLISRVHESGTLGLLMFVAWASSAVAEGPAAEPKPDPEPRWVLTASSVALGETLEAWLLIPRPATQAERTRVTLLAPPGGRVWWAHDQPCGTAKRSVIALETMTDTVYRICGEVSRRDTPFRFVAKIENVSPAARVLTASDILPPRPRWQVPNWLVASLSLLGGWVAYLLSPRIEKAITSHYALKGRQVDLLTYVARVVAPTLRTVRQQLEEYVRAPNDTLQVSEAVYLNIAGAKSGIFSVAPEEERRRYLQPIKALHDTLLEFNDAVDPHKDRDRAKRAAASAIQQIDALLNRPEPAEEAPA